MLKELRRRISEYSVSAEGIFNLGGEPRAVAVVETKGPERTGLSGSGGNKNTGRTYAGRILCASEHCPSVPVLAAA